MKRKYRTVAVAIRPATRERYLQWAASQERRLLAAEDYSEAIEGWLDQKGAKPLSEEWQNYTARQRG